MTKRILVADDNQDSADSLVVLLEMLGHINMPVMDGYEAAKTLRDQHGQRVVLVALTGASPQETAVKAHAAGFDAHYSKPIESSAIRQVIDSVPDSD